MKITSKGQVTVPKDGHALIEHMRGRGTILMSTDEIMALTRGEPDLTEAQGHSEKLLCL